MTVVCYFFPDMQSVRKNKVNTKMNLLEEMSESPASCMSDEEMYLPPTSVTMSEDIWKKFDLPTPPVSPRRESDFDLDLENVTMPFDIDTEDLLLFDDDDLTNEMLKEVISSFPESPPGPDIDSSLQSNLIQDIMWSAPVKTVELSKDQKQRLRCNSCSNPAFNTACVAPDEVFPLEQTPPPSATNLGGAISQTRVHNLGIDTPSDSG